MAVGKGVSVGRGVAVGWGVAVGAGVLVGTGVGRGVGDGTEVAVGAAFAIFTTGLAGSELESDWFSTAKMASPVVATAIPAKTTAALVERGESSIFLIRSDRAIRTCLSCLSSFWVSEIGDHLAWVAPLFIELRLYMRGGCPPLFASAKGGRGERSETQGVHSHATTNT